MTAKLLFKHIHLSRSRCVCVCVIVCVCVQKSVSLRSRISPGARSRRTLITLVTFFHVYGCVASVDSNVLET